MDESDLSAFLVAPPRDDLLRLLFFNDTAPTEIYTLSLHDALPISRVERLDVGDRAAARQRPCDGGRRAGGSTDRKSTRLNSSHVAISYAVFCLKKKMIRTMMMWAARCATSKKPLT